MDVDINQLPIPPWNLACPNCGYCLNGLTKHRCPECGNDFEMAALVLPHVKVRAPQFNGHESPMPDFGISCASCKHPLAGAIDARCPNCQTPYSIDGFLPKNDWFHMAPWMYQGIPMEIVALMLDDAFVPYLHIDGHNAFTAESMHLSISKEFYFDALYLTRQRSMAAKKR